MDIAQYISDILKKHHEVSLPEIGTFSKRDMSAFSSEGVFFPPSQQVVFTSESGSSTLLVQHIISEKNISESSALYFIERFCQNLKDNLRSGGKVEVLPLGFLTKSETGYVFEASESWLHVTSFGLSPVDEIEIIKQPSQKLRVNVPTSGSNIVETVENEGTEPPNKSRTLWVTVFVLLILVALVGVVYVQYPQYFKRAHNLIKKQPLPKALPVSKPDTIKEAESFADSILQELELQGMQGTEVVKTPDSVTVTSRIVTLPDTIKVQAKPARVYEIIVASFGLESEAENAIKVYRKRNIDAKLVIDSKKPKFKVGIGTFTTSDAAHKENKRVQKELTKDAWVLTINNQEK